jgi:hypothetical protein
MSSEMNPASDKTQEEAAPAPAQENAGGEEEKSEPVNEQEELRKAVACAVSSAKAHPRPPSTQVVRIILPSVSETEILVPTKLTQAPCLDLDAYPGAKIYAFTTIFTSTCTKFYKGDGQVGDWVRVVPLNLLEDVAAYATGYLVASLMPIYKGREDEVFRTLKPMELFGMWNVAKHVGCDWLAKLTRALMREQSEAEYDGKPLVTPSGTPFTLTMNVEI